MASTMVRIRAEIRDEIVKNLLNRKFVTENLEIDQLQEALAEKKAAMFDLAYKACFTDAQIKKMESLPKGWLPMARSGKIRIEDPKNPENYCEEECYWADSDSNDDGKRPVPYKNTYQGGGYYMNVITSDHPYVKAKLAYKEARSECDDKTQKLREAKRVAKRRVLTIIESVTTVKRLLEIWPEVHEFLPEMVSGEAGQVPAQMIADINKEFGLGETS